MTLLRLALLGATGYGIYKYSTRAKAVPAGTRTHDGLAAIYNTREQATLAVEHLVQEHGVDRSAVFVEPVDGRNTAGLEISGGDAPSGDEGTRVRDDGALNGAIRVTVAASDRELAPLRQALHDAGAVQVQSF